MKLLGLDFETQGADATTTNITQIGAILVDVEFGQDPTVYKHGQKWTVVEKLDLLVWREDYPPQTDFIVELTGITDEMLKTTGVSPFTALEELNKLVAKAEVIACHKIAFDKTVYESVLEREAMPNPSKKAEWLCTLTNFPWPKRLTCLKLSHIAYEHSVMVDPKTLHRAIADVDLMLRVLAEYDLNTVMHYSREPWVYLVGEVKGPWLDQGAQTTVAKGLGFSWETVKGTSEPKFTKQWVTRVKLGGVDALKEAVAKSSLPFRVGTLQLP